jgi:tRNA(Ile)-lysidine synthase
LVAAGSGLTRDSLGRAVAPWLGRLVGLDDAVAPVAVACSGGADSLALLALATASGLEPVAIHVDHGLRPGSRDEALVVREHADRLGVRTVAARATVDSGANVEARARDARYDALRRVMPASGASVLLVGHTADDQAETVLLNLLRGAAGSGLAGMAVRHGDVRRPLLALRRADTVELCARLRFAPVFDPTNDDRAFRRNWIRHELLPLLERGARRDLVGVLARQAGVLREESVLLDGLATASWPPPGERERPPGAALAAMPLALARRAVRQWIGPPPPSFTEVERVLAVARGERTGTELAGHRRVTRHGGRLQLVTGSGTGAAEPAAGFVYAVPGEAEGLGVHLESWVARRAPTRWPDGRWTCVVDADAIGDTAQVRRGADGRVALCDSSGGVVWTLGYGVARGARVDSGTRRYLWITAAALDTAANTTLEHAHRGGGR